ncbi:type II toxin-antitoxin system HipA family toxin [Acidithiobacillus montserratensis]|uniref:Type II toxin-antitoxin system HipA family toxin n=1 Tax=Acidithiobacillus montserratensis TaxID=2729135 RepID=A0ACD5HIK8_9PROT|nr:type II toxin-antitoxin system HipA family toxin [Acidithiobacillus montserratensis]MBU2747837.1 hypothetical protein [Acidithiobacillus montserratensis]
MEKRSSISVFCNDREVGTLEKRSVLQSSGVRNRHDFRYKENIPEENLVSLLMPVAGREYTDLFDMPISFQTSLPEGWALERLSEQVGKGFALSDKFTLLQVAGRNLIGRLSFGGPRSSRTLDQELLDAIVPTGHEKWMQDLFRSIGAENLGVSGAMPKVVLPRGGSRTLYFQDSILKLESPQYFGITLAEDFALQASREAGIPTVEARRNITGDALLINRFDIEPDGTRKGFEDACALNGFAPAFKYNGCQEKIFTMVESFVSEEYITQDNETVLTILLLNDILRNGDAHLKNFGLIYRSLEDVRLAPSYDVLDTTLFLPNDFPALTIHQHFPAEATQHKQWLNQDRLDDLWDTSNISHGNARQLYQELQETVWNTAQRYRQTILEDPGLDGRRKRFVDYMLDRLEHRLRHDGPAPLGHLWSIRKPDMGAVAEQDTYPALESGIRQPDGKWMNLSLHVPTDGKEHESQLVGTLQRKCPEGYQSAPTIVFQKTDKGLEAIAAFPGEKPLKVTLSKSEHGKAEVTITRDGEMIHERPALLRPNEMLKAIPNHREGQVLRQFLGVDPGKLNINKINDHLHPSNSPGKKKPGIEL